MVLLASGKQRSVVVYFVLDSTGDDKSGLVHGENLTVQAIEGEIQNE